MTPEETKNVANEGTGEETKADDAKKADSDKATKTSATPKDSKKNQKADDAKKADGKNKTPKADNKDVPVYTVSQLRQMPFEDMKKIEKLINAGKAKAVND